MPGFSETAIRGARLAILLVAGTAVWALGNFIAGFRGPRPKNVIWYEGNLLGTGLLGVPFGIAAIGARLGHVPGWDSDIVWWLAAICFSVTGFMALIVLRYRIVITPDTIAEFRVFRRGSRLIDWNSVEGWRMGRRPGSVILQLSSHREFEFASVFKVGSEALTAALDSRNIPEL